MNRRTLSIIAVAGIVAAGCRSSRQDSQADSTAAAMPPVDTLAGAAAADTSAAPPVTTPAPGALVPQPVAQRPVTTAVDEPWSPTSTGTVSPGMDRDQVVGVWGAPAAERSAGDWTYLYFRNGCEVSCGTFDVVFLQGGHVVDAIVRGPGHTYDGTSSSPPGRQAEPTKPSAGGTAE